MTPTSDEIMKCLFDGQFTIQWGHRRGFMNGSEATQRLVGDIKGGLCNFSGRAEYQNKLVVNQQ